MMTIEQIKEVLISFENGETIQRKKRFRKGKDVIWVDTIDPAWNFVEFDYRVKPKETYREYKNQEECFNQITIHGKWIIAKDGMFVFPTAIKDDAVCIQGSFITFKSLLNDGYIWCDDGTPCGINNEK